MDGFDSELPDSVTVEFRYPVAWDARAIRQWFDKQPKGRWRVKFKGESYPLPDASWTTRNTGQSWQSRELWWTTVLKKLALYKNQWPLIVNFDDKDDATLFKLAMG